MLAEKLNERAAPYLKKWREERHEEAIKMSKEIDEEALKIWSAVEKIFLTATPEQLSGNFMIRVNCSRRGKLRYMLSSESHRRWHWLGIVINHQESMKKACQFARSEGILACSCSNIASTWDFSYYAD